jgi:monofunctional biosynthetic peptidoglycan transglycosylase
MLSLRTLFRKTRRWHRPLLRWGLRVLIALAVLPPVLLLLYAVVPPPGTPLMLIRLFEGEGIHRQWVPLENIAPALPQRVIAGEDNLFCSHAGFDLAALRKAASGWLNGTSNAGGSTVSQQTAKNLFFWPGRSFLRKGLEAYATLWMEILWSKQRIMEVYLNIVEWGPGLYGAEAAARHYFNVPSAALSTQQAALMAAVLPNPRRWSPAKPTAYIQNRAATLQRRSSQLGSLLDCTVP